MAAANREASARKLLLLFLLLLGAWRLLWPEDTQFVNDEPALIRAALNVLASGEWPVHGLRGSRGTDYGPFAIGWYSLVLSITRDLELVVLVKTAFTTAASAGAIYWLATSARFLVAPLGALALSSPYLYKYSRDLWDNSFLVPLSALAVAAYVDFLRRQRPITLAIAVLCLSFAVCTHLMVAPLVLAFVLHVAVFHRTFCRTNLAVVAGVAAMAGLIVAPYAGHLLGSGGASVRAGGWSSLLFPWQAGRVFSAFGLEYFLGERWWQRGGGWPAPFIGLTAGGYALVLWGVLRAARRVYAVLRARGPAEPRFQVEVFLLSSFGLYVILCATQALGFHPHYYNAIWPVAFLLAWMAASDAWHSRWFRGVYLAHAVSLTVVLVVVTLRLHHTSGNRLLTFGPSLGTQWALAKQLNRLPRGATVLTGDVPTVRHFPHALGTLQRLAREAPPADPPLPAQTYAIVYRHPEDPEDGELALVPVEVKAR